MMMPNAHKTSFQPKGPGNLGAPGTFIPPTSGASATRMNDDANAASSFNVIHKFDEVLQQPVGSSGS